jgi:hypothetical protein
MEGKTLVAAAAAADMSERTARTWRDGRVPSATKKPRWWRTRSDPFAESWDGEIVPLLERDEEGILEARTILEVLEESRPGRYSESQLRTLQRRMRQWRALYGPEKEVFFAQAHVPGRECAFDFTYASDLGVSVRGDLLEHLLFECVLSFSGWTYARLAFSETYEALTCGLQEALWALGGSPEVARSDNLSAATHELRAARGRALTPRYRGLLEHYAMRSTRIRPGEAHENGVVEQRHYRTKSALAQALVVRGSKDFVSLEAYASFLGTVVEASNRPRAAKLAVERQHLRPLPSSRVPVYTSFHPRVTCWSTVRVGGRTYSVPSRLIGHEVEVRQYPDTVELHYAGRLLETMPRIRGDKTARIDYRHVIWSLVRKPGAFARYRFREELFPSVVFRRAYDALRAGSERADVEYVRILHLAASTMESKVQAVLLRLLEAGDSFDYAKVKTLASPEAAQVPTVSIGPVDLQQYDRLLEGVA